MRYAILLAMVFVAAACVSTGADPVPATASLMAEQTPTAPASPSAGPHAYREVMALGEFAQLSPDGATLAWIRWDHPSMPWDACELVVRDLATGRRQGGEEVSGIRIADGWKLRYLVDAGTKKNAKRVATPLFAVLILIETTDVVFAVDSVPAVYGITGDPYLVFATNAFALLGLRPLYFVLENALGSLVHLGHGLALILAFIGVKLVLHWGHTVWPAVPQIPTLASLAVIIGVLVVVTLTSLAANRRTRARVGAR